jgi:uncharacterized protein YbaP (TraB family)
MDFLAFATGFLKLRFGMKIFWQLLLVICFLADTAFSAEAAEKQEAQTHSLWKVKGKKNEVYLLGSVHLFSKTNYPLPAVIETAYSNSSTVVFEADVGQVEDLSNGVKLLKQMTLPEGQTIEGQLSGPVYGEFTNYLAEAGLPLFMLERFKPVMAAMTITLLESQKVGLDAEHGLDKHFYDLAKQDSKEIGALETVEFQTSLLAGLSKEEGETMLKSTIKDAKDLKKDLGDLVDAWNTGNSSKLEKLVKDVGDEGTTLNKKMVTDRNERWVPQIEDLLKQDKPVLVIVGAAHLVGKQGVVELLKKRKWKVTQL